MDQQMQIPAVRLEDPDLLTGTTAVALFKVAKTP